MKLKVEDNDEKRTRWCGGRANIQASLLLSALLLALVLVGIITISIFSALPFMERQLVVGAISGHAITNSRAQSEGPEALPSRELRKLQLQDPQLFWGLLAVVEGSSSRSSDVGQQNSLHTSSDRVNDKLAAAVEWPVVQQSAAIVNLAPAAVRHETQTAAAAAAMMKARTIMKKLLAVNYVGSEADVAPPLSLSLPTTTSNSGSASEASQLPGRLLLQSAGSPPAGTASGTGGVSHATTSPLGINWPPALLVPPPSSPPPLPPSSSTNPGLPSTLKLPHNGPAAKTTAAWRRKPQPFPSPKKTIIPIPKKTIIPSPKKTITATPVPPPSLPPPLATTPRSANGDGMTSAPPPPSPVPSPPPPFSPAKKYQKGIGTLTLVMLFTAAGVLLVILAVVLFTRGCQIQREPFRKGSADGDSEKGISMKSPAGKGTKEQAKGKATEEILGIALEEEQLESVKHFEAKMRQSVFDEKLKGGQVYPLDRTLGRIESGKEVSFSTSGRIVP